MTTPLFIQATTPYANNAVWVNLIGNAALSRAGGTSASASSGAGGWQVTDRSRQKASTEWEDYYPFVMTCNCLVDIVGGGPGGTIGVDIETQCAALESFEIPVSGSQPPEPPVLFLQGPVPHTDLPWVCSRLDFAGGEDGQIRDDASLLRTQQAFTIEFTEYAPSTAVAQQLSPAQQAQLNAGSALGQTTLTGSGVTYTTKAGDTLQSIAVAKLGNVADWVNIALLNGLALGAILLPGSVISLPAA